MITGHVSGTLFVVRFGSFDCYWVSIQSIYGYLSLYLSMCVYIHIHIFIYLFVCVFIYLHLYTRVCVYLYISIYLYGLCVYIYIYRLSLGGLRAFWLGLSRAWRFGLLSLSYSLSRLCQHVLQTSSIKASLMKGLWSVSGAQMPV